MKEVARIISWSSLIGLTLLPPILFAMEAINEGTLKWLMLFGAVIWFAATPLWMKSNSS